MCSIREKAAVGVPLTLGILIFYFGTLHSSFFNAYLLPDTVVDRAIPFLPIFVIPYFSYYLLLPIPLFFIHDSQELHDAAFGYALIVFTSCVAFFFWPTAISTSFTDPLIRGLLKVDLPRNACPSLHASLSLFCALCTQRNLRSKTAKFGLWLWTVMVIASTLFTKRHAVVDIIAGIIFGSVVYRVIFSPTYHQTREAGVDSPELPNRSLVASAEQAASASRDAGTRTRNFALSATVAVIGSSISIWAIAHSTPAAFTIGALTTIASLYFLLRLLAERAHAEFDSHRRRNWIGRFLLGSIFFTSFSAVRLRHQRHPQSAREDASAHNTPRPLGVRFSQLLRRIGALALSPILIPVSALRSGSPTQRKIVCAEYALLFLVWSALLRIFSARSLLLVWILPLALAAIVTAVQTSLRQSPPNASDRCLPTQT